MTKKHTEQAKDKPATPDTLWKEMIEKFFLSFISFCKPELYDKIDYGKTIFLEEELRSITGKTHKGIVDVLARIHLKKGGEEYIVWLCGSALHVE